MEFNAQYVERLKNLGLLVDGLVPITRANLAVHDSSVREQCVYAFMYTVPSQPGHPTFATSAMADLKRNADGSVENVAAGDISTGGLVQKASFIIQTLDEKLREIAASWSLVTQIRIYTVHPIDIIVREVILPTVGSAAHHGVTWYYVYPPVVGLELEIDARGVLREYVVKAQ
jgi:hypothetical protein